MDQPPSNFHGETMVGIVTLAMPDGATCFAAGVLRAALEAGLRRDQVAHSSRGGFCVQAFTVATISTVDRAGALRSIHSTLTELGLAKYSLIAYWDELEMYWRPVFGGIGRFEDFVSEAVMGEAKARVQAVSGMVQHLTEALQRAQAQEGGAGRGTK